MSPGKSFAQSDKIPGMSLGSFKVGNTGSASYSIPVITPPGTNGLAPKLALSYDSQRQSGIAGVGWSLEGLPAIHRCPRTVAQDGTKGGVMYDANDRYCFEGQRLMVINGLADGANNAEYRTELDSFVRIFSYGQVATPGVGPQYWVVKTKSGETMEFGGNATSVEGRIEAVGKISVRVWALSKLTDANGNYLTVTYTEDPVNGEYRPTRIDYTGNAGQGLSPQRYVELLYEDRTDAPSLYVSGSLIKTTKRLKTIRTWAPPPQGGAAVLVREYRLVYEYGAVTRRSRLKSITECAGDGSCLPANLFNWQEGRVVTASPPGQSGFDLPLNPTASALDTAQIKQNLVADLNGDGRADILALVGGTGGHSAKIHFWNGNGFDIVPWDINFQAPSGTTIREYNYVGDFNGDGLSDIVSWGGPLPTVHLSTGANFDIQTWAGGLLSGTAFWPPTVNRVGDFNGDGLSDIVSWVPGSTTVNLNLSTGSNFNWIKGVTAYTTGVYYMAQTVVGDFNGDGLSDLVSRYNGTTALVELSTGTAFVHKNWTGSFDV